MQCGGPRMRRRVVSRSERERVQMTLRTALVSSATLGTPRKLRDTSIKFGFHAFQGCAEKYLGLSASIVPLMR